MRKYLSPILFIVIAIVVALSFRNKEDHKEIISDYQILINPEGSMLEGMVRDKISRGWEPIGGITYVNGQWVQAVVKH